MLTPFIEGLIVIMDKGGNGGLVIGGGGAGFIYV